MGDQLPKMPKNGETAPKMGDPVFCTHHSWGFSITQRDWVCINCGLRSAERPKELPRCQ